MESTGRSLLWGLLFFLLSVELAFGNVETKKNNRQRRGVKKMVNSICRIKKEESGRACVKKVEIALREFWLLEQEYEKILNVAGWLLKRFKLSSKVVFHLYEGSHKLSEEQSLRRKKIPQRNNIESPKNKLPDARMGIVGFSCIKWNLMPLMKEGLYLN
ncbi:ubiquinone biosynthesis O-methyltransferase [Striga asiatica]|uniref:Ubiquinone biosynthesis O-methyltransferase n=1 Tax=Striga asiatica TaxID=4170 RepID=A0A5A7R2V6_STRAF|nr:ubiquinone biosynthesis O-methyltransferase [Striga asiatica]